jgi:hypothetical protein
MTHWTYEATPHDSLASQLSARAQHKSSITSPRENSEQLVIDIFKVCAIENISKKELQQVIEKFVSDTSYRDVRILHQVLRKVVASAKHTSNLNDLLMMENMKLKDIFKQNNGSQTERTTDHSTNSVLSHTSTGSNSPRTERRPSFQINVPSSPRPTLTRGLSTSKILNTTNLFTPSSTNTPTPPSVTTPVTSVLPTNPTESATFPSISKKSTSTVVSNHNSKVHRKQLDSSEEEECSEDSFESYVSEFSDEVVDRRETDLKELEQEQIAIRRKEEEKRREEERHRIYNNANNANNNSQKTRRHTLLTHGHVHPPLHEYKLPTVHNDTEIHKVPTQSNAYTRHASYGLMQISQQNPLQIKRLNRVSTMQYQSSGGKVESPIAGGAPTLHINTRVPISSHALTSLSPLERHKQQKKKLQQKLAHYGYPI